MSTRGSNSSAPASGAARPTVSALGTVTLVIGPEELLNERVVSAVRVALVREAPEAEVTSARGDQLTPASLGELAAPSLFSTTRLVVVTQLEDAPEETHEELLSYAGAPESDIALVLVHSGGPKGSGLLAKLRKLPAVREHRSEAVKPREVAGFLRQEVRRHGGRIDDAAAEVLVDAVGADLRALAAAADQLTHDFPEQALTVDVVRRYFSGRADVKGFEIADLALSGRTAAALEELRWALDSGVSAPALTGSFASSVRSLARVAGAPRGLRDADLARQAGVPPWKLRLLRDQLRGWDDRGLGTAVRAVAAADAEVKGAGADAAYSLERMVLAITGARTSR